MFTRSWHWFANWAESRVIYCPRCNKAMPCRKMMVDGAWVCQRCGRRI